MHEKVAYLEDLVCTRDCKNQASCENRAVAAPRTLPTSLSPRRLSLQA